MITVINLRIGNIASVSRALKHLNIPHAVTDKPDEVSGAEKIIFPGVGNFSEAVKRMKHLGIDKALTQRVLIDKVPILGICLGMQLFASSGEEGGVSEGLNFIKGRVAYHRAQGKGLRLPHIGWNDVNFKDFRIFDSIKNNSCFYFVHSYEFVPSEPVKAAYSNYGVDFVAALQKEHIIGIQFHPEKSQEAGLMLIKNFCEGKF